MWENESKCVVLLTQLKENDKVCVHKIAKQIVSMLSEVLNNHLFYVHVGDVLLLLAND